LDDIRRAATQDEWYQKILKLKTDEDPEEQGKAAREAEHYDVDQGMLFRRVAVQGTPLKVPAVPKPVRYKILQALHDEPSAAHLGAQKTYDKVRRRFFWPQLKKDVRRYVRTCASCQARKSSLKDRRLGYLMPIPVGKPFDRVAMDILGPLPTTKAGNKYIIVAMDYLTRYTEIAPLPSQITKHVAKFFVQRIFATHGPCRTLLTDRGSNFCSKLMAKILALFKTGHDRTTAYHPQTDGLVERFNATLEQMLTPYVNTPQDNWDEHLPFVQFAYNTAVQATTGYSPFYLLYGREPVMPLDVIGNRKTTDIAENTPELVLRLEEARSTARRNIDQVQQRMKARYDAHRRPHKFKEGQLVMKRRLGRIKKGRSKKLTSRWEGPYKIAKMRPPVNVIIKKMKGRHKTQTVHVDHLKTYHARPHEDVSGQAGGRCYVPAPGPHMKLDSVEVQKMDH
jgi:hypothetical protein